MADIKQFTGRTQGGMNINLDINTLPDMPCIKCGEKEFNNITRIKKLSRTISPNGQEGNVNVNMLKCSNCGWLFNPKEWEDHQTSNVPLDDKQSAGTSLRCVPPDVPLDDKQDDHKTICRKCGDFYVRGTTHDCKADLAVKVNESIDFNDKVGIN